MSEGFNEGFTTSAASLFGDVLPQPGDSGEPRPKKQRLGGRTEDSLDARVVYRTPHWQQKSPAWLQRKVLVDAGYVAPEPEARREMVTTQDNAAEEVARAEKEWNEQGKSHHVLDHEVFSTSSEGSSGGPPLTLEQQRDVELRRSAKRRDRKRRAAAVLVRREAKRRREAVLLDDPDEQPVVGLLDEASPFGVAAAAGLVEASRPAEAETPQVDQDGRLYNFCLNRECPAYQCSEIRIQQRWDGKCCGMRNQPAVGQLTAFDEGVGGEDDGGDEEASEGDDWSFNTEELAELAKEDPESAQMVTDIRKTYSGIGQAADADGADDAAEDGDEDDEAEEDEESESSSEAGPDAAEQHAFVANCVLLLRGTQDALISPDGVHHVVEPMSTLVARLTTLVADLEARTGVSFGAAGDEGAPAEEAAAPPAAAEDAGATADASEAASAGATEERPLPSLNLDASEWFAFKQSALETIRLIRNEASSAKVAARPPKAPLVVDDKVYDI